MKEKEILKVSTVSTTSPTVEVLADQKTEQVKKLTTSRVEQAPKATNPYPARVFLKVDNQEEDIPVFFRIKDSDNWVIPKIKTGSYLEVQGNFSIGTVYIKQSERKSFTATAYQLLQEPKPLNTKDLITLTSGLLSTTLEKYKEWTNRKDFLFKKLDELKEITTLAKIGDNFLQAYLTLKKAQYANYQEKHLNSNFDLTHYLETISTEIQLVKSHIEAYQSKQISHGK